MLRRLVIGSAVAVVCLASTPAQWIVNEPAPAGNTQTLALGGTPTPGSLISLTLTAPTGSQFVLLLAAHRRTQQISAGTVTVDLTRLLGFTVGTMPAGGSLSFQIPFPAVLVGQSLIWQALYVLPNQTAELSNASVIYTTGAGLEVSPAKLVLPSAGGTQQLSVLLEQGNLRSDVTNDPATGFSSSVPAVVSVGPGGLMNLLSVGQAQVTATFTTLQAIADIEINPALRARIEASVGQAGGTVAFASGTGVCVPPGAMAQAQRIVIEEVGLTGVGVPPGGTILGGNGVDFRPTGLQFSEPIDLSVGYDAGQIPGGFDEESTLVFALSSRNVLVPDTLQDDEIESVGQGLDLGAKVVTTETDHFSCRALVVGLGLTSSTLAAAADGTAIVAFQNHKPMEPTPAQSTAKNCRCKTASQFVVPPTRVAATIQYVVLHSTNSINPNTRFSGEVRNAADQHTCYYAHYYVGKDGTIVEVLDPDQRADHVAGGNGVTDDNSIGIEIFNNHGPGNAGAAPPTTRSYPGRQMSAVVRLCDYLMKRYPSIGSSARIVTHSFVDGKDDPSGDFRSNRWIFQGQSTSLEDIVRRAMMSDHDGLVLATGGDGLGGASQSSLGGFGGDVTLRAGDDALANNFVNGRPSIVHSGGTMALPAGTTQLMHLVVQGTPQDPAVLTVGQDTTLDVDGILYVGPHGRIDARPVPADGADGHAITVNADGFALIEGEVLSSGGHKDTGEGSGGSAGNFTFRTAAPGPIYVPTIITRAGDADDISLGGFGGDVRIEALQDAAGDRIEVLFRGRRGQADYFEIDGQPMETLPLPAPFNQMPVITATPPASHTCPANPSGNIFTLRPTSGERLALGRRYTVSTRTPGTSIALFDRGILTVGGMGGVGATSSTGGPAGDGGGIVIANQTLGCLRFDSTDLFTGAGIESVGHIIFIASSWCGDFAFYKCPSGGLGGRGGFLGGDGGPGGVAGPIIVSGFVFDAATNQGTLAVTLAGQVPVFGYNAGLIDTSGSSGEVQIGDLLFFDQSFRTDSTSGSGGMAAGRASGFPGRSGPMGTNGATTINGTTWFQ